MKAIFAAAGSWAANHVLPVVVVGGILYFGFWGKKEKELQEREKLIDQKAAELQATVGQRVSETELVKSIVSPLLQQFAQQMKAVDKLVSVVEKTKTTAEISDVISGHVGKEEVPRGTPTEFWADEYHRFHLSFPSGTVLGKGNLALDRHQLFSYEALVVRGVDGSHRFQKADFKELDPSTRQEIPLTGVKLENNFQFVDERPQAASPWHVRAAAFGGPQIGLGLGGQINPWKILIVSGGAAYSGKSGLSGFAGLGGRVKLPWFDSTLGISAVATYGKGGLGADGVGSVEVTR